MMMMMMTIMLHGSGFGHVKDRCVYF